MANLNLYDIFRRKQAYGSGSIDLSSVTTKCALVAAGYTPNQNTHDFFNDITNEVTGTGYTAGGNTCANPSVTLSAAGLVTIDFDDPATWLQDAAGFNDAVRAIFYRDSGVATTSELIGYTDTFTAGGNVAGDFEVALSASGLITSSR